MANKTKIKNNKIDKFKDNVDILKKNRASQNNSSKNSKKLDMAKISKV